jgi:anti-sigma regulatory factor (Ser/Thr protein kinase)
MHADRIIIGNRIEELRRMTYWLTDSASAAGMAKDLVMKLDVCANEAVMNIISYAFADSAPHEIVLDLTVISGGARLVIRDGGVPFNPLQLPEHTTPASLEDAEIGGLGVHLARCDYQRDGGENVLCLEARQDPHPANA